MDDRRTGIPEVDALLDAADHEHVASRNLVVVNTAESTVASARLADIASQQMAARRSWSAARGLLTKAQKNGDAAKIAAARERETAAYREYDAISKAAIDEGFGIVAAGNERLGRQLDQMQRTNTADAAVLDALTKRPD